MHEDKVHFNLGKNGYQSCMCSCGDCLGFKWSNCICKDCSCHDTSFTLHDHDQDGAKPPSLRGKPERACVNCGQEVFRTHSRGRWPIRCIACRS